MDFFISAYFYDNWVLVLSQRVAGQAAQINISGFLVLIIPMNLPQSRKRVRQWAPRFREFHLHSTKRTLPYSFVQPAWGRSGRGR